MSHSYNKNKKANSCIIIIIGIAMIFGSVFFVARDTFAIKVPSTGTGTSVTVSDPERKQEEQTKEQEKEWYDKLLTAGGAAFKNALGYFLNTIAIDTATYLASGDEGQKPLFYTEGWGPYLQREADNAAGHFIEGVASGMGYSGICTPSFDFRIGLSLGIKQYAKPLPPDCKFTTMMKNWETQANKSLDYMRDPAKFLDGMNAYFSPNENHFAVGLTMYSNFYSKSLGDVAAKSRQREEGQGMKALQDPVTGEIKTPSKIIGLIPEGMQQRMTAKEEKYIETIYGVGVNAFDAFTSTLVSKFLERMMKKGLALLSGQSKEERFDWSNIEALTSPNASPQRAGADEARAEFASSFAPSFSVGDPSVNKMDIPTFLLDDKVINAKFKTAIDRKLTVQEAIDQGLLQMDGPGSTFGYSSADKEPDVNEGIAYASTFILRKYRVIPVGWEIAASYIKANFQQKIYSLGDIIRGYDDSSSPFYRLIDKNWVLKSPETFCRMEGAGEKLSMDDWKTEKLFDEKAGSYDFNRHIVSREYYCADSKSCIYQDDKGNCMYYGYCTEEKSLWRFDSKVCPSQYNTCQRFVDTKDKTFTYLANSIQAENCSVSNVGCQWYCKDFNPYDNEWTCTGSGERTIKPCDKYGSCSGSSSQCSTNADCPNGQTCNGDIGCDVVDSKTGETCTIDPGHVTCIVPRCKAEANVVKNPGFERIGTGVALADSWDRIGATFQYIKRVSGMGQKVSGGTYSLSLAYYDGIVNEIKARTVDINVNPTVATTYILAGKIYNSLTYGSAKLGILNIADPLLPFLNAPDGCTTDSNMAKSQWVDVSCTFSVQPQAGGTNFAVGAVIENNTPPVGTAWFDDISVNPACPQNDIIVYMNAEEDVNESKIYFDKEVKECDAQNSGCRQFVRTKEGLGTNLIANGSFEDWEEGSDPAGWTTRPGAAFAYGKVTEDIPQGSNAIYITDGGIASSIIPSMDDGLYIISLYARRHVAGAQGQLGIALEYTNPAGAPRAVRFNFLGVDNKVLEDKWTRYVSDPLDVSLYQGTNFYISIIEVGGAAGSDIDGVMLESVSRGVKSATTYKDYGASNVVFLKKPPEYLECLGDPARDHTSCSKYAFMCGKEEVGCELYTPANGDPPVPGIVRAYDYCTNECVGYQSYKQSASYFEGEKIDNYFIAEKAKTCDSESVGCEEFTNLDKASKGGEAREYFTYIRQCQKPNDSCGSFYTWVGSDVAGLQLRVFSLVDVIDNSTNAAGADGIPDEIPSVRTDLGDCANATDATTNPNCREFYSEAGGIGAPKYAILQNTISCTDECFPYRLSNSTQNDCEGSGGYWGVCTNGVANLSSTECSTIQGIVLIGSNECYAKQVGPVSCVGAGWNFTPRDQCFYQSVPSEGETCSAAAAGCREYRGTASANVRVVFSDDFESGTTNKWTLGRGILSNDAIAVGGHSLRTQIYNDGIADHNVINTLIIGGLPICAENSADYPNCSDNLKINCFDAKTNTCVGTNEQCIMSIGQPVCSSLYNKVISGRSYVLSFWAKSADAVVENIDVALTSNPGPITENIGRVQVNQEWKEFVLGPFNFTNPAYNSNIFIQFSSDHTGAGGSHPVNYDFITIKQIEEYEYLIKNSWTIPATCDTNPYLDPAVFPAPNAPQFMLGCQQYANRDGKTLYLKSFDTLCREAAIGCEKLIDTRNSDSPFPETFNEKYNASRIDIPNDGVAYLVNSPEGSCSVENKGCTTVGNPTIDVDGEVRGYKTISYINDPEKYSISLCNEDGYGCQEYVSEQEGLVYFKDPKSRTCSYKVVPGTSSYGWFKAGSQASFPDCPTAPDVLGAIQPAKSCVGGTTPGKACTRDEECLGEGRCQSWTGICTEENIGCNAYVDPVSTISNNILPNGNAESYQLVCEAAPTIPCTIGGDQCPGNGKCGPATRAYIWNPTLTGVLHHALGGVGNSAVFEITDAASSIRQIVNLEEGKLYTILIQSKNTIGNARVELQIPGAGTFRQFDNSVSINLQGDTVTLSAVNTGDEYKAFAGRFYAAKLAQGATFSAQADAGWFDNIELKKTGTYYYLSGKVDNKSCNGNVNPEVGCVLFNDLSNNLLMYNSLLTEKDKQPFRCAGSGCDTNIILKVRPDRDCGKWLECVTGREQMNFKTGKRDTYCQQMALCDSLNPANGQCNNFPAVAQTTQEFNIGNVDLIKNFTGYSKVGYSWGNVKVDGLYPYSAMQQGKICIKPDANYGKDCVENEDCQTSALAHDGDCQPVLNVGVKKAVYESCRMYPEGGSPRWGATGPVDTGDKPAVGNVVNLNNPIALLGSVTPAALATASECTYEKDGNRFEGIKGFCVEKDPRSPYLCMNWLPIDEITGGWIGMSGWVENIRDDVFYCASGAVLEQRKLWTNTTVPIDRDVNCQTEPMFTCPTGYIKSFRSRNLRLGFEPQKRCYFTCTPDYSDYKMTTPDGYEWFDYREKFDNAGSFIKKSKVYCSHWGCGYEGTVILDPESTDAANKDAKGYLMVCDAVSKVTDSDGTNKAWKRRLEVVPDFKGFNYSLPDYNFTLDTKYRPFGSINSKLAGDPTSWPYILDFIEVAKVDRPYVNGDTNSNNGQLFHDIFSNNDPVPYITTYVGGQERMKRLFAQSYGNWQWNGSTYQSQNGSQRCVGGKNNGVDCSAGASVCVDSASTCNAPGYCEYYSTDASVQPMVSLEPCNEAWNVAMDSDPATPAPAGSCFAPAAVFCATGMCTGADPALSSYTPCSVLGAVCAIGGETCQDSQNFCSGGLNVTKNCNVLADCLPPDQRARCVGKCSAGSALAGKDCRTESECRVSGQCASFTYWNPPQNQCKNNFRSNYFTTNFTGTCGVAGADCDVRNPADCGGNLSQCLPNDQNAPGDWCGIPPQVYNVSIENATGDIFEISNGSGNVTLKFNVKVDEEQLPMRFLSINWGDGSANTMTQSKFGLRDKPDLNDPFIFPHVYTYNPAHATNEYTIHIKVRDNWDWCTCPKTPIQCTPNDCTDDNTSSVSVSTIVKVTE